MKGPSDIGNPIYRTNEPRQKPADCIVTKMTDEQRAWMNSIPPQQNPKPAFRKPKTPTTVKAEKHSSLSGDGRKVRGNTNHLHITKELIENQLALGRTLTQIADDHNAPRDLVKRRAVKHELYKAKEYVRRISKGGKELRFIK